MDSITGAFKRAVNYLFPPKGSNIVPFESVRSALDLDNKLYESMPEFHNPTLCLLGRADQIRGPHFGPARAFLLDPKSTLKIPGYESQFSDVPFTPEESVNSSAGIIFTGFNLPFKRRAFGAIIRMKQTDIDMRPEIFGIFGICDKNNNMKVKKLLIMERDSTTKVLKEGLRSVPITQDNIQRALLYAKECRKQLFEKGSLSPRENLRRAEEAFEKLTPPSLDK